MLAGLEHPDRGDIRIDGRSVVALEPKDRDVALVFQSYALYPHLSARENIRYPLRIKRMSDAERAELLSPPGLLAPPPARSAGGERQAVALAGAMVRTRLVSLRVEPLSTL